MISRTHELAALTLLNLFILTQPIPKMDYPTSIFAVSAALIGGIFPDIDKPTSEIWDRFPGGSIIGHLLQPFLGKHRHFSHSILGALFYSYVIKLLLNWMGAFVIINMQIVWVAFVIGLVSHILIDSLNKSGVPLLFPINIKFGLMGIRTGGFGEKVIIFPGLIGLNLYLLASQYKTYLSILKNLF